MSTAYLVTTALLWCIGLWATLQTKPGAPRKPEPSARSLMALATIQTTLLLWSLALITREFAQ